MFGVPPASSIHERWVFQAHVRFQVVSEMVFRRLQVQAHVVSLLGKVLKLFGLSAWSIHRFACGWFTVPKNPLWNYCYELWMKEFNYQSWTLTNHSIGWYDILNPIAHWASAYRTNMASLESQTHISWLMSQRHESSMTFSSVSCTVMLRQC